MSLLFIILDTFLRGVVLVGIYQGGRYLYREARKGFPSLNNPSHKYAEAQVHAYGVANQYHHWKGTDGITYLHEACKDEYQAEEAQLYQFFEIWLDEADTEHSCEWCE
jgi:hypothetical protein